MYTSDWGGSSDWTSDWTSDWAKAIIEYRKKSYRKENENKRSTLIRIKDLQNEINTLKERLNCKERLLCLDIEDTNNLNELFKNEDHSEIWGDDGQHRIWWFQKSISEDGMVEYYVVKKNTSKNYWVWEENSSVHICKRPDKRACKHPFSSLKDAVAWIKMFGTEE